MVVIIVEEAEAEEWHTEAVAIMIIIVVARATVTVPSAISAIPLPAVPAMYFLYQALIQCGQGGISRSQSTCQWAG
jgi:hypothetical protein